MAVYVTGKQRTLKWSGLITGDNLELWECISGGPVKTKDSKSTWSIEATGFASMYCTSTTGGGVPLDCTPAPATARITLYAALSHGTPGVLSDSAYTEVAWTRPGEYNLPGDGTWEITCDVEEVFEVDMLDGDLLDEFGFPKYGGAAQRDGMPGTKIQWYERARIGGTLRATATIGSATVTVYSTITSNFVPGWGMTGWAKATAFNTLNTSALTTKYQGLQCGAPWSRESASGSAKVNTLTGFSATARDTTGVGATVQCWGTLYADVLYKLNGRMRAEEDPYPGSMGMIWVYKNDPTHTGLTKQVYAAPNLTDQVVQKAYTVYGLLNEEGVTPLYSADEQFTRNTLPGHRIHINQFGNDDSRDWRVQWSGVPFVAAQLKQEEYVEIWP